MAERWNVLIGIGAGILIILRSRAGARESVEFWMGRRPFGIQQFPDATKRYQYERSVRYLYVAVGFAFVVLGAWSLVTRQP